jgi:tetratricopeptide (TPR) repeat protein
VSGALWGQKLNEAFLRAKAAMLLQQYTVAEQEILSIPEQERIPAMSFALGESYYFSGQYAKAIRQFESGKITPEAQLYTARAYAMLSQPAQAVEYLQKYLRQRDKLSESELELDAALQKAEHSKEWRVLWEKEWYNAAERKASEATTLLKRKKYTEALAIIEENIKKNASAGWWILRAQVYTAMEQDEPALESYRTAIQLRNNPAGYLDAAVIAARLQKYELALEYIQNAVKLDPYRLDAYLQRANMLRMNKQYDEARKDINFYFTYFPADDQAFYQMGVTETESGNPLSGIEYLSKLLDRDKSRPEYFAARAKAYIKTDNYEQANDDLAQALDLNPRSPEVWLQKGIALHQTNDFEGACHCWQKAMNLGSKEAGGYIFKYCGK